MMRASKPSRKMMVNAEMNKNQGEVGVLVLPRAVFSWSLIVAAAASILSMLAPDFIKAGIAPKLPSIAVFKFTSRAPTLFSIPLPSNSSKYKSCTSAIAFWTFPAL